jgi:hypothetical protein
MFAFAFNCNALAYFSFAIYYLIKFHFTLAYVRLFTLKDVPLHLEI